MAELSGPPSTPDVRGMFSRIARRYGLVNRLISLGQDASWRRWAVSKLAPRPGQVLLDVGAGTGELSIQLQQRSSECRLVAVDFSLPMLAIGRARAPSNVRWIVADAHHLPFAAGVFDGTISAFLLRNVVDLDQALAEQWRVLAPQGRLVALDTTPPRSGPFRPLVLFHLRCIVPLTGRLATGDAEAYNYLRRSTESFASAETVAARLVAVGFCNVSFAHRMLGAVALHCAHKSGRVSPNDQRSSGGNRHGE